MRSTKNITVNGKTLFEILEEEKENIYLRFADLSFADLSFADLRSADLSFADLSSADLRSADLRSADLSFADLRSAIGDLSVFSGGKHQGIATCTHIAIGCERRTHAQWRKEYKNIGEANEYTDGEIERYRAWIFSLDWLIAKEKG